MKRRNLIKYLSVLPLSGAIIGSESPFQPVMADEADFKGQGSSNNQPKRIAAIITEYRPGSHADVIIGKYLEGYNQDQMAPYPDSKIVSIFTESLSRSGTRKDGDVRTLVKKPAVFIIDYNDGLKAAAFLMTGLVEDFTVAVEVAGQQKPVSTLMRMQNGKPHYHFGCLVKNIEIMFKTGKAPYPVERTMLSSGILDFALESRILGYKKLETPELSQVRYLSSPESHFFSKGWDSNGKRLD